MLQASQLYNFHLQQEFEPTKPPVKSNFINPPTLGFQPFSGCWIKPKVSCIRDVPEVRKNQRMGWACDKWIWRVRWWNKQKITIENHRFLVFSEILRFWFLYLNVPHIKKTVGCLQQPDLRCSAVGSLRTCRVTGFTQWQKTGGRHEKTSLAKFFGTGKFCIFHKNMSCVIIIDYMKNKRFHTFFCIWPSQSTNVYRMRIFTKSILMTFEMFLFNQPFLDLIRSNNSWVTIMTPICLIPFMIFNHYAWKTRQLVGKPSNL